MTTPRSLTATVLAAVVTAVCLTAWRLGDETTSPASPIPRPLASTPPVAAPAAPIGLGPSAEATVTCTVTVRNTGSRCVDARLRLPHPVSRPPFAAVSDVTFTPQGVAETTDAAGARGVRISFDGLRSGESRRASVRMRVRTTQVVLDVDTRAITDPPLAPALRPLVEAAAGLPVDDDAVRRAVGTITRGERNPWLRLVALYDYVRRLRYELGSRPRAVGEVLRSRRAQCSDAAALLVTLARAAGLPARYVGGFFMTDEMSSTRDAHAWAEVWIGGLGWVPLDPTMGRFDDDVRASRLGAQMTGYVPLWEGLESPFRIDAPTGGALTVQVTFAWRGLRFERTRSLLTCFPPPALAAHVGPAPSPSTAREAAPSRAEVPGLLRAAARFARVRETRRALSALGEAQARAPESEAVWRALIGVYAALEIWDGVAVCAERAAVAVSTGDAAAGGGAVPLRGTFLMMAGQAHVRQGDWPRARDAFRAALRDVPADGWLHAMLGWSLRECGDRSGARASVARGLQLGIEGTDRDFFVRMQADLAAPTP